MTINSTKTLNHTLTKQQRLRLDVRTFVVVCFCVLSCIKGSRLTTWTDQRNFECKYISVPAMTSIWIKHTLSLWILKLFFSNYLWKRRQHTLGSTIWITLLDWNVVVVFNRWRQQGIPTRIPKRRLPTCLHAKHITSTCLHTLRLLGSTHE